MKILHLCFGIEHYIDTWGYQQNMLPLYHVKLGHEVIVLASNDTYPSFLPSSLVGLIKMKGNDYKNGSVHVIRNSSFFNRFIHFQISRSLYKRLLEEKPDILFFHGAFNLSLLSCLRYKIKMKECFLVLDNHGDDYNVNTNKLYRFLFLKCFWRFIHFIAQKKVDLYYGVTNLRCDFLLKYLKIDSRKVKLLPIGADVDMVNALSENRQILRSQYGFNEDDIVLVHGGKLDSRKGTQNLIEAYLKLKKHYNVKLVLFGEIIDKGIELQIKDDTDIVFISWLSRSQLFELYSMADLAIWPIHHTTLIEDAIAVGLPILIRKTRTTEHLINSSFYLEEGSCTEIVRLLVAFLDTEDKDDYKMNIDRLCDSINYYNIAGKIIEDYNKFLSNRIDEKTKTN